MIDFESFAEQGEHGLMGGVLPVAYNGSTDKRLDGHSTYTTSLARGQVA